MIGPALDLPAVRLILKALLYIPVVLSLVVLGAHFMRDGDTIFVVSAVVLIALLFVRQPWVARLMQVVLALGALEWVRTLYELVQLRAALGEPYGRMAIILGLVAVVTACSALAFQSKALKGVYGLEPMAATDKSSGGPKTGP